jgi:hypothetical protein
MLQFHVVRNIRDIVIYIYIYIYIYIFCIQPENGFCSRNMSLMNDHKLSCVQTSYSFYLAVRLNHNIDSSPKNAIWGSEIVYGNNS